MANWWENDAVADGGGRPAGGQAATSGEWWSRDAESGSRVPSTAPKLDASRAIGSLESGAAGAIQGATSGFADEVYGALATPAALFNGKSFADTYSSNRDDARDYFARAQAQNPTAYGAGDIGGSVAGALIPGGIVGKAAGLGARGLMAAGAAQGALRGAGDAEELSDVPSDALRGGLIGGALGGAAGAVAPVGRGLERAGALSSATGKLMGDTITDTFKGSGLVGGFANKAAPRIDGVVDAGIDRLAQMSPRLGEAAGDLYNGTIGGANGIAARTAVGSFLGHSPTAIEAGLRTGGWAAQGTGRALQAAEGRVGAGGVAAASDVANRDGPEVDAQQVLSDPTIVGSRVQGTKYAGVFADAMNKGTANVQALLWALKQDPEFRRTIGVSLKDYQ